MSANFVFSLFNAEQLEEIMDAEMSEKSKLSRGIAVISTALKLNEENRQSGESFLISGGEDGEVLSDLLSQSELTESEAGIIP